jgi:1-deoxy-D-xylulose-5-phosphate reductoisomerase
MISGASQPSARRRVLILGSTGSIGRQAIEVVRAHPERFEVVGLVAGHDEDALARQADELGVPATGLGSEAAERAATDVDCDVVLNAVVGAAGLRASVATLRAGKVLALANKESLVAGGDVCLAAARDGGGTIVAVDSEHSAIAQALQGAARESVERLILTASGGPFRTRRELDSVTPAEALAHPTWQMGPKITIDSATMMNKGLEVIEAHHLFGFDYDRIDIVVHPQSTVHGVVEFVDGSMLMSASPTDMRIPIQAALSHPERLPSAGERIDPSKLGSLDFEPLDQERFPAVSIAYQAGRRGATFPAVMNAANEVAVAAFLDGRLTFTGIAEVVADVVESHDGSDVSSLEDVLEADGQARAAAQRSIGARN